jgi:tRNA dimethylallyltransferase
VTEALAVVGPTASGKSALALALAQRLDGEIVSCDSVQVYRGMDIGTGKATPEERALVPHHLLDVASPAESFHAGRYVALAEEAIRDIAARGKLPILVGGTGLYYRALVQGLFEAPPSDPATRERHRREAEDLGVESLHARLLAVDPRAGARIMPRDLVRISRALEIFEQTGTPISVLWQQAAQKKSLRPWAVMLSPPLPALRALIERRVEHMMALGFREEVESLRARHGRETHAFGALGYKQLAAHLDGLMPFDQAVAETKTATVAYARRQRTWFRKEVVAQVVEVAGAEDAVTHAAEIVAAFRRRDSLVE